MSYLVVYVATLPSNNTYLIFLLQEKSGLLYFFWTTFYFPSDRISYSSFLPNFRVRNGNKPVWKFFSHGMFRYADIICTEMFSVFFVFVFFFWKSSTLVLSVLNSCMTFSRELSLKTSSSDVLSVFEITRSVFFVLQFTVKSISVTLVLTSCLLSWDRFDFVEKFFIYSVKKFVICSIYKVIIYST